MNIKIVYNSKTENLLQLKNDFPNINFIFYNDEYYKELKKAILLKAGLGTKLTPFCVIYNEDNIPIKCFYTEIKECNYNIIKKYLNENNK